MLNFNRKLIFFSQEDLIDYVTFLSKIMLSRKQKYFFNDLYFIFNFGTWNKKNKNKTSIKTIYIYNDEIDFKYMRSIDETKPHHI